MKKHLPLTFFALSLAGLLAFPPLGLASGGKKQHAMEHESVDIEHRTTHEQQEVNRDALPEVSRFPDEAKDTQQQVTTERREIHRDLQGQDKESHHDD